jgi:hypothetical protein
MTALLHPPSPFSDALPVRDHNLWPDAGIGPTSVPSLAPAASFFSRGAGRLLHVVFASGENLSFLRSKKP